ncbi:MAG: ATP-binding protein [Lachnospiraceae bacterium]|nr:ATP-binding protein [Lachnospiraceae bacterium]
MRELRNVAKLDNLDEVIAFVEEQLEEHDCPPKLVIQINIAVEEIYVNIAHYAYTPEIGEAVVQTEFSEDPSGITITFIDSGKPFDPLAKPDPDVTLPAEERQIGGLGIYMVKKSMDDVQYERKDGKNILTITKRW